MSGSVLRPSALSRGSAAAAMWTSLLTFSMMSAAMPEDAASSADPSGDNLRAMVATQIEGRGIRDARVLEAMRRVPRQRFVPENLRSRAFEDNPLPLGQGQTISQPYIVAFMTEAARLRPGERVLEVGTGSGYQAAVLSAVGARVYSIEILAELAESARRTLKDTGYGDVSVRTGDGFRGWPEEAPFDAIVVTAAPEEVPEPLLAQLKPGGRLIIPLGSGHQDLLRVTRTPSGYQRETLLPVRFVPMTGEARRSRP